MNFISKEALQRIREEYTEGTRFELTRMSDPYRTDLVPGCRGDGSVCGRYGYHPCELGYRIFTRCCIRRGCL